MPRVSNKESKNIYFSRREELKLISLKRSCCFGEKKGTIKP